MRRGQAFEVFRLLIAAVIAGAILMVLLNILHIIQPRTQDPQDFVNQAVQSLATTGGIKTSSTITFEKGQAILLSAAAAAATIDTGCVQAGSVFDPQCFNTNGGMIEYVCTQKRKAKIRVKCEQSSSNPNCPVMCDVEIIKP